MGTSIANSIATSIFDLVRAQVESRSSALALWSQKGTLTYEALCHQSTQLAQYLRQKNAARHQRVAIFLPKSVEWVVAMLGTNAAGGIFVPINPVLKPSQVDHILTNSGARILISTHDRIKALLPEIECEPNSDPILVDLEDRSCIPLKNALSRDTAEDASSFVSDPLDTDIAAIFYTSGSTGAPKGVVLSNRNMVAGAYSVASYLENTHEDRILSLLPLSFDAGFSQLTTAFSVGASVYLFDYLFPQDVIRLVGEHKISGITGVPPLWAQLVSKDWPEEISGSVRYFANTGGKMPESLLAQLRSTFPSASPYLMYGLTEAFRSTYLDPDQVDQRPDSIGKAIPNAQILVLRPDGTECAADEPGELVHIGPLVAQGYWQDAEKTAKRFKTIPIPSADDPIQYERAVFSGDIVRRDVDGFLYFVSRADEMLKTSGYRVSPTEIEEVAYQTGVVKEAVAVGLPDDVLGHKIVLIVAPEAPDQESDLLKSFKQHLPIYMVPKEIHWQSELPRSPNGKFDRVRILAHIKDSS